MISLHLAKERIAIANQALQTYWPGLEIWLQEGKLLARDQYSKGNCNLALRSDGCTLQNYDALNSGHTRKSSLVQLVRYIYDWPRYGIQVWEHWASDKIKLCGMDTVQILKENDYDDPKRTNCILCGQPCQRGTDWWSVGWFAGPSCLYSHCQDGSNSSLSELTATTRVIYSDSGIGSRQPTGQGGHAVYPTSFASNGTLPGS